jgi:dGTPase
MKLDKKDIEYIVVNLRNYSNTSNRFINEDEGLRDRNPFQRDYSRILYSSSFRRLQGKMQLLAISSMDFHRNRLTHSYEVAQIARSIAEYINSNIDDATFHIPIYVVESASLAHDIGNPPFGHYGEKILNKIANDIGGFEGNAQTLRVLMNLERKIPNEKGLNLTIRTLLSVIKYFNKAKDSEKFIYDNDYDAILSGLTDHEINLLPRTIEAQIMDLSDEIAYAAHDLEDALGQKFFNIDDLLYEFEKNTKYSDAFEPFNEIVQKSKNKAKNCTSLTSDTYNFYLKKELTSNLVFELIQDIKLCKVTDEIKKKTGTSQAYELNYQNLGKLAEGLKMLTFNCVKRSDNVQIYEKKGEVVVNKLVEVYMNQDFNKKFELLPVQYRPDKNIIDSSNLEAALKRNVIDYISGMMDSFAFSTYNRFYGNDSILMKFDPKIYK